METVLKDLCEQTYVEKNAEVRVVCSNVCSTLKIEQINHIKIIRVPRIGIFFSQPLNPTLIFHLIRESKWADIIHIHTPNPIAELLSFCLRKPKVITHHSDIINQKLLKFFYVPIFKIFLKTIDSIIIPTINHIKYSKMINNSKNYEIIPFALKEKSFLINDEISKTSEIFLKENGKFFLFVGRLVGYKGIEYLIEAMKEVDAKLIIVGEGPLENDLANLIKKNNLNSKIEMKGRIEDNNQFNAIYHSCYALVLPSITPNENFGVVQLEAMKCSKAIITTRLESGVPLVAKENESSLLVEPKNSKQLAEAMNKLLDNPELTIQMGKKGFERFNTKYQMKKFINEHYSLYQKIINKNKSN